MLQFSNTEVGDRWCSLACKELSHQHRQSFCIRIKIAFDISVSLRSFNLVSQSDDTTVRLNDSPCKSPASVLYSLCFDMEIYISTNRSAPSCSHWHSYYSLVTLLKKVAWLTFSLYLLQLSIYPRVIHLTWLLCLLQSGGRGRCVFCCEGYGLPPSLTSSSMIV